MKTLWAGFLGLGLLVVGCGTDPAAGAREADAGDDAQLAADAHPAGSGGATADTGATGGAGGQAADTGGAIGTGGAGTGGAVGTGGAQGSGGTTGGGGAAGTGGAMGTGGVPVLPTCSTPGGLPIVGDSCEYAQGAAPPGQLFPEKYGLRCVTNCQTRTPQGFPIENAKPECVISPSNYFCVFTCKECR